MKRTRSQKGRYLASMLLGTAISAVPLSAHAATDDAVANLSRYCNTSWRNAGVQNDCWSDCTQEVFVRLLERTNPAKWSGVLSDESAEREEFLRAIDTVKKRSKRAHRYASLGEDVADDSRHGEQREELRQRLLQSAAAQLSARQASILGLSLDGWTVREIAEQIQVSAARVSDEKYKAIKKLRRHFANGMI